MILHQRTLATLGLIFATFVWGSTFVVVQDAIATVPPFTFNAIRFGLSALCFAPFLFIMRKRGEEFTPLSTATWAKGIVIGVCLWGGFILQTFGLLYTTSTKAGFLTGLCVVLVPIFAYFLGQWQPTKQGITSILLSLLGLYLLSFKGAEGFQFGDLLIVGCAVSFALHILCTSHFLKSVDVFTLTWMSLVVVALLSGVCGVLFETWTVALDASLWTDGRFLFGMGVSVLLSTIFGFLMQTYAQTVLPTIRVALIFTLEPVFAAVMGVMFVGDVMSTMNWFGATAILLAMVVMELPSRREIQQVA
ncbi:MAG: DMT family transporter [Bacilli bacterium]